MTTLAASVSSSQLATRAPFIHFRELNVPPNRHRAALILFPISGIHSYAATPPDAFLLPRIGGLSCSGRP
jgi:hypothetical protein